MFLIVFTVTLWTGGGCMKWWYMFQWNPRKIANYQIRSRNPVLRQDNKFITWTEMKLHQLAQSRLEDSNAVIKLVRIEISFKVA